MERKRRKKVVERLVEGTEKGKTENMKMKGKLLRGGGKRLRTT